MAVPIRIKTPPEQIHDHLQTGVTRTIQVDAASLERELHSTIRGEVRFGAGDRALYSSDASNYRQVPIGVVIPRDKEDVIRTVAACRRYGAPILARGGGTGIPGVINFLTHAPLLDGIAKFVAGIHPEREIPNFAPYTFKEWFRRRKTGRQGDREERGQGDKEARGSSQSAIRNPQSAINRMILRADTFNNYFHPRTAQAAVDVLEAAGFDVAVPKRNLCCGRPLYDWGMLDDLRNHRSVFFSPAFFLSAKPKQKMQDGKIRQQPPTSRRLVGHIRGRNYAW